MNQTSDFSITDTNVVTESSIDVKPLIVHEFMDMSVTVQCTNSMPSFEKDTLYSETGDVYTVLTRKLVPNFCHSVNKKLYINGKVKKIVLVDFPWSGHYILSLNGCNVCTAQLIKDNDDGVLRPTFDLSRYSESLSVFKTMCNQAFNPLISNQFIDLSRVDDIRINVSKTTELLHTHTIHLYECNDNGLQYDKKIYKFYPKSTYEITLDGPTHSLILNTSRNINFKIMINGHTLGPFNCGNECYIRLIDNYNMFNGVQNQYLNEQQIKSLNFSRVDCCCIAVLDEDIDQLNMRLEQLVFIQYNKKDLSERFPI